MRNFYWSYTLPPYNRREQMVFPGRKQRHQLWLNMDGKLLKMLPVPTAAVWSCIIVQNWTVGGAQRQEAVLHMLLRREKTFKTWSTQSLRSLKLHMGFDNLYSSVIFSSNSSGSRLMNIGFESETMMHWWRGAYAWWSQAAAGGLVKIAKELFG